MCAQPAGLGYQPLVHGLNPCCADSQNSCCGPQNFIQDGTKGEDFNRNLYNAHLDFATIHVYPQVQPTVL